VAARHLLVQGPLSADRERLGSLFEVPRLEQKQTVITSVG
jgi:hypothetical protein